MGAARVLAREDGIYLIHEARRPERFPPPTEAGLPTDLLSALFRLDPSTPVVATGAELAGRLAGALGREVGRASVADWHSAIAALPPPEPAGERERLLARARRDLAAGLRSPVEVLVSLAREEERFERTVGREARASEAFVAVDGTVLAEHAAEWKRTRELLTAHHHELLRRLEHEARVTVPNLSALLGPRTAARLVAAAGGVAPLGRMPAARLQLLGTRRRPSPERGPRFGVIYRADGVEALPLDRRGAFARSVAALAAIAARADAWTQRDLRRSLIVRRDARLSQLRRRGR